MRGLAHRRGVPRERHASSGGAPRRGRAPPGTAPSSRAAAAPRGCRASSRGSSSLGCRCGSRMSFLPSWETASDRVCVTCPFSLPSETTHATKNAFNLTNRPASRGRLVAGTQILGFDPDPNLTIKMRFDHQNAWLFWARNLMRFQFVFEPNGSNTKPRSHPRFGALRRSPVSILWGRAHVPTESSRGPGSLFAHRYVLPQQCIRGGGAGRDRHRCGECSGAGRRPGAPAISRRFGRT